MTRAWIAVVACAACATVPATQGAGEPMRVGVTLMEPPVVGRMAPDVALPYATAGGAGPADQPFDLRKELGRVVVVAFCRLAIAEECTAQWTAFRDQQTMMFGSNVIVAGVLPDSVESLVRFAQDHQLPFKLLSDPSRTVARRLGFMDGSRVVHTMLVIGRDGRVRYIDRTFDPATASSQSNLAAAIKAARES